MKLLKQHIEALIFTADQPVSPEEISNCLKTVYGWELSKDEVSEVADQLKEKYADEEFGFELTEIGGGYQFLSKKDFHTSIHVMLQLKEKKRLSTAAMETLSIIAYKQPVTKPELEQIRGVSCDYSIQKLLEKDLIVISGKSDGPGRPLLYKTSQNFMDHFGLKSVKDLPKLKDIQPEENQIGSPSDLIELLESEDTEITADAPEVTEENEHDMDEAVRIQPEIVDEVLEQTENQTTELSPEEEEHSSEEISEEVTDTHSQ